MAIPALSTGDKLFICSYNIGSDIDHRKALGVINEITTFTSEYIDGFCWVPVNATITDNNDSWWWDLGDKDTVYVKVGVRVAADGYLHAWLLDTQKVSELILWNNNYNTAHQPNDDTTVLHLCIERMYRVIFGNTTSFVTANIKFQTYVAGSTRLYLFGNYSNSLTNSVNYTIDTAYVKKSSWTWYPNNSSTSLSDYLYSSLAGWAKICNQSDIDFTRIAYISATKAFLDDGGSFTDYTAEFNDGRNVPLIPAVEQVDDAFYYGSNHKFKGVKFFIGTAGVGSGVTWEYWDGSAWSSLSVSDGTNDFTVAGENSVTWTPRADWSTCTVNGATYYWIRSRVNDASYTTQPILNLGKIHEVSYWVDFSGAFGKSPEHPEPIFYYHQHGVSGSVSIPSVCNPTDPIDKEFDLCHIPNQISAATGNNSGRSYNVASAFASPACPGEGFTDCGSGTSNQKMYIDYTPNRAYIWVPGSCSGGAGCSAHGNQTDCEAAGCTWTPGHYTCDPAFTYDSQVNFTYGKWTSKSPDTIDYATAGARFLDFIDCYPTWPVHILAVYYSGGIYDTFNEYWNNDLDELKHGDFTITTPGINTNRMLTVFTKHVGIGLLTSGALTSYTNDWIVNWGAADYFSGWSTPDGLAVRTPAVTNVPYTRPVTHWDEFNVVANEPTLGGFLYDLATSNAFLNRNVDVETKIVHPVNNLSDFSFLNDLLTSNGFLERSVDIEVKITHPVCDKSDFNFLYALITSNGFLERSVDVETKILYPICNNSDFSFLYELIEPPFAVRYYLSTLGDDTKDGLSQANAWEHFTYAMANVPDERTLIVRNGTYNDAESTIGPSNSIVIFLVDTSWVDNPAIVTIILV